MELEWTGWDLNPGLPACKAGDLPLIYRPRRAHSVAAQMKLSARIRGYNRTQPDSTLIRISEMKEPWVVPRTEPSDGLSGCASWSEASASWPARICSGP